MSDLLLRLRWLVWTHVYVNGRAYFSESAARCEAYGALLKESLATRRRAAD
jgi:hypothetical protein